MTKTSFLSLLALALSVSTSLKAQTTGFSLDTNDNVKWSVMPKADVPDSGSVVSKVGYNMKEAVPGVVPGVVFTAYVNAGKEKDPNYADNIYRVDETFYSRPFWYRTEFDLPASIAPGQHVWLCFDNTNRYADFYFNGHKISGTEKSIRDVSGHMMRSRFDVTPYIHRGGKNGVAVLIYDADQKKTRKGEGPYGVACSPSYLAGAGWDWMPYVPGRLAGITGHARVEITGDAVMDDPWVRTKLNSTFTTADIELCSDLRNLSSKAENITVEGVIMPGAIKFSKTVRVEAGQKGYITIDKRDAPAMSMQNPRLWMPNGYGDPNLYTCKLTCKAGDNVSETKTITFGIRKYEYRIEKNAVGYPVLTLLVNGQRVFIKGGNWGMSEYLLRCHGKEYEPKIRLHKEMNYNMIRLWTGCVTDDEFYDYCDKYGIMVWNDFWLYVAWNDVVEHDAFKANARDKVRRLRNHASIAVWCGANETRPVPDLDQALRMTVMEEDGNDRLYTSCSNQDAKSGSGWWKDMPPRHHFETSASNLAFNKPAYPYGYNYGYGFRSEIGMATFPQYESVKLFIPKDQQWPLPTDEQLEKDDETVWNKHFFGKEAWNGGPIDYKHSVNDRYGESKGLEEFCEKAQLINLEDMKGMYEAWNDKMWDDASALIIWMSHPAYPSFVWQTYDYYYDPTGCYWGAKKACEPQHVQWNCLTNSIKVINATATPLRGASVTARIYDMQGKELESLCREATVNCEASNKAEAFKLEFGVAQTEGMQFIRLELRAADGKLLSTNFYWRSADGKLDYRALNTLPQANVKAQLVSRDGDKAVVRLYNTSKTVAFANRLRLVNAKTGERVLPVIMDDNYVTLLPGETADITIEASAEQMKGGCKLLLKQYSKKEKAVLNIK